MSEKETHFQTEWEKNVENNTRGLQLAAPEFVNHGRTFETTTSQGKRITIETQFYYCEDKKIYGVSVPCKPPGEGMRHYLLATDENKQLLGIVVTSVFREGSKLFANPRVVVKDRGQKLATPLTDALVESLQEIANTENAEVVWEIYNENLEKLQERRAASDVSPEILAKLEEEQQRWQYLYGENGKYGITRGKRVFTPKRKEG